MIQCNYRPPSSLRFPSCLLSLYSLSVSPSPSSSMVPFLLSRFISDIQSHISNIVLHLPHTPHMCYFLRLHSTSSQYFSQHHIPSSTPLLHSASASLTLSIHLPAAQHYTSTLSRPLHHLHLHHHHASPDLYSTLLSPFSQLPSASNLPWHGKTNTVGRQTASCLWLSESAQKKSYVVVMVVVGMCSWEYLCE